MSRCDDTFFGLWGDPDAAERLGPLDPRVLRRGQRIAQRNGQPRGGIGLPDVASAIAASLRRGDQPGAQQLIAAAGQLFDGTALAIEVAAQARRLESEALQAEQDAQEYQANGHAADPWDL